MEESRKVYGWLVRDRNAAVGCSSLWADAMGEETPIRFVFRQVVNCTNKRCNMWYMKLGSYRESSKSVAMSTFFIHFPSASSENDIRSTMKLVKEGKTEK